MTHQDDLERLSADPLDDTDGHILAELRDLWTAADPAPEGMTDRIRFAMTVASLEAEVARIAEESLAGSGVRSVYERASTVTFTSGSLSAMIDIDSGDSSVGISGWVSETGVEVELRERHRSRTTTVDGSGRFAFSAVERGLVHFVFRRTDDPGTHPVITPTIEV